VLHGLAALDANNFDRLALSDVSLVLRSESPANAGCGARPIDNQVFDRELRRRGPMGRTNDLLESVWTVERLTAPTLVVEVGGGNILMALVSIACRERGKHPS
jgi:hypothetical protein